MTGNTSCHNRCLKKFRNETSCIFYNVSGHNAASAEARLMSWTFRTMDRFIVGAEGTSVWMSERIARDFWVLNAGECSWTKRVSVIVYLTAAGNTQKSVVLVSKMQCIMLLRKRKQEQSASWMLSHVRKPGQCHANPCLCCYYRNINVLNNFTIIWLQNLSQNQVWHHHNDNIRMQHSSIHVCGSWVQLL